MWEELKISLAKSSVINEKRKFLSVFLQQSKFHFQLNLKLSTRAIMQT
jgi:hypothetical protein